MSLEKKDWILELLENQPNAPATNGTLLFFAHELRSGFRTQSLEIGRLSTSLDQVATQTAKLSLDMTQVKQDVSNLTHTVARIEEDLLIMREQLSTKASKDDLKNFATKDDLKNFATKDDLKNFATKDDLVALRLATQEDLAREIGKVIALLQARP